MMLALTNCYFGAPAHCTVVRMTHPRAPDNFLLTYVVSLEIHSLLQCVRRTKYAKGGSQQYRCIIQCAVPQSAAHGLYFRFCLSKITSGGKIARSGKPMKKTQQVEQLRPHFSLISLLLRMGAFTSKSHVVNNVQATTNI